MCPPSLWKRNAKHLESQLKYLVQTCASALSNPDNDLGTVLQGHPTHSSKSVQTLDMTTKREHDCQSVLHVICSTCLSWLGFDLPLSDLSFKYTLIKISQHQICQAEFKGKIHRKWCPGFECFSQVWRDVLQQAEMQCVDVISNRV